MIYIDTKIKGFVSEAIRLETRSPTITESIKRSRARRRSILYLPLYNEVSKLEIGVPTSTSFFFVPTTGESPIILYGTSIAQGACASRPGMAWGNIVSRTLNWPLINLDFSGNGKLETEIISLICEQRPSIVILDCMPNETIAQTHLFTASTFHLQTSGDLG